VLSVWFDTIGVFRRCPVPALSSRSDNFGVMVRLPKVPVHRHQGIDIIAPAGSPILAPFDGVAHSGVGVLGGNTVIVDGALGWVYNAHLSAFSERSNGPVHAGDVIGYVGATGDASGSHDHFEFHPARFPSNWPASPYGYTVVGTAIDPNLLLDVVCP
jgi:murein DD-endopeptidase MepM/ murein hydrolase activator NlpD